MLNTIDNVITDNKMKAKAVYQLHVDPEAAATHLLAAALP